jgi:hypothetical protein
MKLGRNLGTLLIAVWFILTGAIELFRFSFSGLPTLMAILALAGGILLLLGR